MNPHSGETSCVTCMMQVNYRNLLLCRMSKWRLTDVLGRTYASENCSAARALEIVGERWSLLIIRDAVFRGRTRFTEFQRSLRVAPNILASRLERFVAEGLMEKRRYSERLELFDYELTEKGRELGAVIIALTTWGDRWEAPLGPPIVFKHHECVGAVSVDVRCERCGSSVPLGAVDALPGPGRSRPADRRSLPRAHDPQRPSR